MIDERAYAYANMIDVRLLGGISLLYISRCIVTLKKSIRALRSFPKFTKPAISSKNASIYQQTRRESAMLPNRLQTRRPIW